MYEQVAIRTRKFREKLESIVEATEASKMSPLAAEWILDALDHMPYNTDEKSLAENWKLYYMMYRLAEYHWVDPKDDLPHKFTFATRAQLLAVGYHSRKFTVTDFERMLANTSNKMT